MLKKIVIIGPESTGKSNLSKNLANYFNTVFVEEFARQYLITNGKEYTYDDLLTIAKGQIALEEKGMQMLTTDNWPATIRKLQTENSIQQETGSIPNTQYPIPIFIDTNMYVMKVWCEFVFKKCHQWILDKIAESKYDLYLLCNIDLPWIKDDLREYPDIGTRKKLYKYYEDILVNQAVPWVDISGNYDERLTKAIQAVNNLLQQQTT
jgi:nicotinamide riboside kinase